MFFFSSLILWHYIALISISFTYITFQHKSSFTLLLSQEIVFLFCYFISNHVFPSSLCQLFWTRKLILHNTLWFDAVVCLVDRWHWQSMTSVFPPPPMACHILRNIHKPEGKVVQATSHPFFLLSQWIIYTLILPVTGSAVFNF